MGTAIIDTASVDILFDVTSSLQTFHLTCLLFSPSIFAPVLLKFQFHPYTFRDVWRMYLERGEFGLAKEYSKV